MNLDRLSEIRIDHTDENGVTHFDGYEIDSDEGEVLAYGVDGKVYYCRPEYRYNEIVKKAVEDYIDKFKSK